MLQECGNQRDIIRARQRQGAPSVTGGQQPRRSARRKLLLRGDAQLRSAAGEQFGGVDPDACVGREAVGDRLGLPQQLLGIANVVIRTAAR